MKKAFRLIANHRNFTLFSIITEFWFILSVWFLTYMYMIEKDELLSKSELLFLVLLFFISSILFFLFQIKAGKKKIPEAGLIILSLIFGFVSLRVFTGKINPSFSLVSNFQIEILDMDQNAEFDLYWAYWAEEPDRAGEEIMDYQRAFDISFSKFEKTGDWEVSDEGYLSVKKPDSKLVFQTTGLRSHIPVICINTRNGKGTAAVTYNNETKFITLNGVDKDPIPLSGYSFSLISRIFEKFIFGIALSGIFYFIFRIASILFFNPIRSLFQKILSPQKSKRWFRQEAVICLAAFFVPIVLLLIVNAFIGAYPFGGKSFLIIDMERQYSSYLSYLRTFFSENNNIFYTFSKNLGGDMISLYAYYLANPLNFLVCLFPAENFPKILTLLILIRFGLCGFTANLFLRKTMRSGISSVIFSTAYALMAYTLMNAENIFFVDGVIFLPLVALGINQIVSRKNPFVYIAALALVVIINFYIGYMICLFSILYFIYKLLLSPVKLNQKEIKSTVKQYLSASLLGIGIACFLLIPTMVQLSAGTKSLNPDNLTFTGKFQLFDLISKFYTGSFTNNDRIETGLPVIFCGIFPVVLVLLYFLNRNFSLKEKILTFGIIGIIGISFHIRIIDLIWHGFSPPVGWPYRYSFIFSFLIILTSYRCWCNLDGIPVKSIIIASFIVIFVSICVEKINYESLSIKEIYSDVFLSLIFCSIIAILNKTYFDNSGLPFFRNTMFLTGIIFLVSSVNMTMNALMIWNNNLESSVSVSDYEENVKKIKPVIEEIEKNDNSFYRIEQMAPAGKNDPMKFGYNGVTHYSSTTNADVLFFLERLGFEQIHYWNYYGNGSTGAVNSLLGIKYILSNQPQNPYRYPSIMTENGINVYQNPYTLALAYTVSKEILSIDFQSDNLFEIQNRMLKGMTGNELPNLFRKAKVDKYSFSNPEWDSDVTSANEITWKITAENSDFLYAYFPAPLISFLDLSVNNESLEDYFINDRYGIVPLGQFSAGDPIIITLRFNMKPLNQNLKFQIDQIYASIENAFFYYEDSNLLRAYFELLNSEPAQLEKISGSHLQGSVSIASDGRYLFFTIPYDKSWTIKIDGKKSAPVKVFNALMAVKIGAGSHTIDMTYIPEGFLPGAGLSGFSLLIVLFWIFKYRKKSVSLVPV